MVSSASACVYFQRILALCGTARLDATFGVSDTFIVNDSNFITFNDMQRCKHTMLLLPQKMDEANISIQCIINRLSFNLLAPYPDDFRWYVYEGITFV